ncbi:MAG: hypothetical protein MUC97_04605 [Bernardetiaceae bacterium]|jgi:hypothetical protein|nr:hypothetical protein [Bernardetiaceae bacterium]
MRNKKTLAANFSPLQWTLSQTAPPIFGPGLGAGAVRFRQGPAPVEVPPLMCHYSYYYHWLRQTDTVLASCPLGEQDRLELTTKHLRVRAQGHWRVLPLSHLKNLEIHFRRLMLPMLTGGIVAPLALVATLNGLFNPIGGIITAFLGLALLYYGIMGSHQVKVNLYQATSVTYFAEARSAQLEQVVQAVNQRLAWLQTPPSRLDLGERALSV